MNQRNSRKSALARGIVAAGSLLFADVSMAQYGEPLTYGLDVTFGF